MSVNIMDLARNAISSQILGQIGGILGEDEDSTTSAIGSVLPALIGGIANQAESDKNLGAISDLLDQQDDGLLDNIGNMLGDDNRSGFMNMGSGLLGTLLGGSQTGIVNMLIRATGLGNTKVGSLLSILAPIVLGIVNRQRKNSNLGIGGLGELLKGQKKHVASSLPEGFEDLVGIGQPDHGTSRPVPSGGGSLFGKLLPLILLLGAGFLLLKILPGLGSKPEDPNEIIPIQQTEGLTGRPPSTLEDGPLQDVMEDDAPTTIILDGPLSDAAAETVEGSAVELQLDPNK